jgi:hypothetical protein
MSSFFTHILVPKITKLKRKQKKAAQRLFVQKNVDEFHTCGQFHQNFYVQFFCTNVVLAAFSSYVPALVDTCKRKSSA